MDIGFITTILKVGINDGLVVFPIVLGVALLYQHLKVIDIHVDGSVVLSGLAAAYAWRLSGGSYALSLIAAIVDCNCPAGTFIVCL